MNSDKIKNRLLFLINEAEQKIEEAKKAGDDKIRLYYEGSLYCTNMIISAMDCSIKVVDGQKTIVETTTKTYIK